MIYFELRIGAACSTKIARYWKMRLVSRQERTSCDWRSCAGLTVASNAVGLSLLGSCNSQTRVVMESITCLSPASSSLSSEPAIVAKESTHGRQLENERWFR